AEAGFIALSGWCQNGASLVSMGTMATANASMGTPLFLAIYSISARPSGAAIIWAAKTNNKGAKASHLFFMRYFLTNRQEGAQQSCCALRKCKIWLILYLLFQ